MNIITKQLNNISKDVNLATFGDVTEILFIDIETTGFQAVSSSLYLIGCAYFDGITYTCKQFFAEKPSEESKILAEFLKFASRFRILIHFNGNNFDIPYLDEKCKKYGLDSIFVDMIGIDLYRRISPYKNFLKLPNCKQKTLEQYLHIDRKDIYSGKDLVNVYHEYVKLFNVDQLTKLLIHNEEDIQGMINITPMLTYTYIFNEKLIVTKVNMDTYVDANGEKNTALVMKLKLPAKLPQPITHMAGGCYFKGENTDGVLKVPVYDGELKYFYSNYKDYYYLPAEDEALHKSVASFVDPAHRIQAQASTCYTRVTSHFLQEWELLYTPFFKKDYSDKEIYFEITDERKKDREFFSEYSSHVLNIISSLVI